MMKMDGCVVARCRGGRGFIGVIREPKPSADGGEAAGGRGGRGFWSGFAVHLLVLDSIY